MNNANGQILRSVKSDAQHLDEMCIWMAANCMLTITWEILARLSGLSQSELVTKFSIHLKTTPMTYIRKCRESMAQKDKHLADHKTIEKCFFTYHE